MRIESIIAGMGEEAIKKLILSRLKDAKMKSIVVYLHEKDGKEECKFHNFEINILEHLRDLQNKNSRLEMEIGILKQEIQNLNK